MAFVDPQSMVTLFEFLKRETGVSLTIEKAYLVESRLKPLLADHGIESLKGLCDILPSRVDLRSKVLQAMTTHETLFFRDDTVYKALAKIFTEDLPALCPTRRLRIWSAACSTGQEPYSLSMHLMESLPDAARWDIKIVATDVADESLAFASEGVYGLHEINRGLPTAFCMKYFVQEGRRWKVVDALRSLIRFEKGNLFKEPPEGGPFDMIFCRNVLIYFEHEDCLKVLKNLHGSLASRGLLILGATENLLNRSKGYEPHASRVPGIYVKHKTELP